MFWSDTNDHSVRGKWPYCFYCANWQPFLEQTYHVLLSGPKPQNTNCTDMFSTAVMRHKQQTSGRLRTANNTIVKCFFKFMPVVSVSFHQLCPSFDGIRSIDSTSRQVLLSKEYFLWSSLQRFDKSFVSRHFCWCVSDVNSFHREYRLITPTFLWDYSHIVPLNQIEVTSETWTSIVYNLVVSGPSGVMQDLHYVVTIDWQFSRPARLIFPSGASRPIGNIRTHKVRVETIFGGLPCRRSLTPCVSPSRAPVLSFARYFQAPATQARDGGTGHTPWLQAFQSLVGCPFSESPQ